MIIIKLTYIKPLEEIIRLRPAHVEFLQQYKEMFLISGPQEPRTGGIVVAFSNDKKAIAELLQQDPFISENAAEYELIQFVPMNFQPAIKELLLTHDEHPSQ